MLILQCYDDLDMSARQEYNRIRWSCEKKLLSNYTLCYNSKTENNGVLVSGAMNPFVAAPSPIELAMLCGYWERLNGGEVKIDEVGGFQVFMYDKGYNPEGR